MKKTKIIIIAGLISTSALYGQVQISSGSSQAEPSAGLKIDFPDKGFLIPRLTGEEIRAIGNPSAGLMVYNVSDNKPVFYDGIKWRNQDGTATWFDCGDILEVIHIAGTIAPVSKTVGYGTTSGIPDETGLCWITRNLGADRQASSVSDASEASAGWYWQFNRMQGFKHDGTNRTPNTTWIAAIDENSDWTSGNDPCTGELGSGWRIPTITEWTNVDLGSGIDWQDWNGPWYSSLKLHAAGRLNYNNGVVDYRGSNGRYWSLSQGTDTAGCVYRFNSTIAFIDNVYNKTFGCSVRCVKNPCGSTPQVPEDGSHELAFNWIRWKWNAVPEATGYKWSTVNSFEMAEDMGTDTSRLETPLNANTNYTRYVWAYNDCSHTAADTLFATTLLFNCGTDSLTIYHIAGDVSPVTITAKYGTVTGIPGATTKCWITSNLGADHQASAKNDNTEASAGWYWQFNRKQGYKHDGSTRTPETAWIAEIVEDLNWMSSNNPCLILLGTGWRIPTQTEWNNVDAAGGWTNWNGPWNSGLKIHVAGNLNYDDGDLIGRGTTGFYWSSSGSGPNISLYQMIYSTGCGWNVASRAEGQSVRCIKP